MTDINDDYSPHDAADEARAEDPPDGYGQRPPLDLDELQKLYDRAGEPGAVPGWGKVVYLRVPDLIAELREARERIAGFEALETRMEIVVASGHPDKAGLVIPFQSYVKAAEHADKTPGCQVFHRFHSLHPWQEIDPKAPF